MKTERATMDGTGLKVMLEVFFMTLSAPASIRYAVRRREITTSGIDPDDGVPQLIADAEDDGLAVKREQCFIHSTSWRYEHDHTIVLTYLVYSDFMALPDGTGTVFRLGEVPLADSADPLRPRPTEIKEAQVAAHALRHLSFLVKNGPSAVYGILSPETQNLLMSITDLPAGKLAVNKPATDGTALSAVQAFHSVKATNRTSGKDAFGLNPG